MNTFYDRISPLIFLVVQFFVQKHDNQAAQGKQQKGIVTGGPDIGREYQTPGKERAHSSHHDSGERSKEQPAQILDDILADCQGIYLYVLFHGSLLCGSGKSIYRAISLQAFTVRIFLSSV